MISISSLLNDSKSLIDQKLTEVLEGASWSDELQEIIAYALEAGGKRFRPFLVLEVAKMLGLNPEPATQVASAIEIVHTYSLIHDDLPSMDNALMRRGKPSCWRQFNEAKAILAGDAMIPMAFEILGHPNTHPKAEIRLKLIMELAKASGAKGMVAGQLLDITQTSQITLPQVQQLQLLKTGELIAFSCTASAFLSEANEDVITTLQNYGFDLGLLFQITDDFLDLSLSAKTGKDTHIDHKKVTFVSLMGEEGARAFLKNLAGHMQESIASLPYNTEVLEAIPSWVAERTH